MVDADIVSAKLADAVGRAVGLRNIVVRGYAGMRPEYLHEGATAGLSDLERFAREIGVWIQESAKG